MFGAPIHSMNSYRFTKRLRKITLIGLLGALLALFNGVWTWQANAGGQQNLADATAIPNTTETVAPTEPVSVSSTPEPIPAGTVLPLYFPLVFQKYSQEPVQYLPTQTILYCSSPSQSIPDNSTSGASNTIEVSDTRLIGDLNISLDILHSWVGDLVVTLTHNDTGKTVTLIDRPGYPATSQGCRRQDISAILDDDITLPVEDQCAPSPSAVAGIFIPNMPLSTFDLERVSGAWTLTVMDLDAYNTGRLNSWCLAAEVSDAPAPSIPPPPISGLPPEAYLQGFSGQDQALPLDCESRVAVDWARYFGFQINELKFQSQLPRSDNPDQGFVGDVYGQWGQIPPYPYGVHAGPVASLLRAYDIPAYAHRPLSWDGLRAEIASGRPVYVWVIGSVFTGEPVYYAAMDGLYPVVAPYEHVVNVIGYSGSSVTIQDGDSTYTRSLDLFLRSWSALGNMAITASP